MEVVAAVVVAVVAIFVFPIGHFLQLANVVSLNVLTDLAF